jgi:hypothetical protein
LIQRYTCRVRQELSNSIFLGARTHIPRVCAIGEGKGEAARSCYTRYFRIQSFDSPTRKSRTVPGPKLCKSRRGPKAMDPDLCITQHRLWISISLRYIILYLRASDPACMHTVAEAASAAAEMDIATRGWRYMTGGK